MNSVCPGNLLGHTEFALIGCVETHTGIEGDGDLTHDDTHVQDSKNTDSAGPGDSALAALLVNEPVAAHVEVFEEVISRLTAELKIED